MIVLDENIVEDEAQLLRAWRISFRQIGQNIGRAGMKDEEIIPFLHSLKRVTFITRDLRFYSRETPHSNHCLLVLAVEQQEVASFARRFLKHSDFNTTQKRMGTIIQANQNGLRVRRLNQPSDTVVPWLRLV